MRLTTLTVALGLSAALAPALPCAGAARVPRANSARLSSAPSLSMDELERQISARLTRVPEFAYIRETAKRLGIRAYLFGGTAAGYAHYVKWDLLRQAGDRRYQPDRFDYDYTNIYRSTQDLDIVVDGTEAQAAALEAALRENYPHLQGSKSAWEVRLLRDARGQGSGRKDALLGNPDFLNQHTDSNSTGLIELTPPPRGQEAIRDLRDWKAKRPIFLQDVFAGRLHYYFSPAHGETLRAQQGLNPPILSAIRYLTKAFQYELEISPADEKLIRKVIAGFDAGRDLREPYARDWVERNGKKLFQHAVNLEYAADVLDRLGLRAALIGLGDPAAKDSLAWWLSRMPLGSRPLGKGKGRTAASLGLTQVSHDTSDFLAYESITRAHTGDPNVFYSRNGVIGESAAAGEGFYTAVGRKGAASNITIRFTVDPKAVEGADFFRASRRGSKVADGDHVVFLNKAALRVVPESLQLGIQEYFRWLIDGKLDPRDQGVLEKLRRRIDARSAAVSEGELDRIAALMLKHIATLEADQWGVVRWTPAIFEWLSLNSTARRPEVLQAIASLPPLPSLRRSEFSPSPANLELIRRLTRNTLRSRNPSQGLIAMSAAADLPGTLTMAKEAPPQGLVSVREHLVSRVREHYDFVIFAQQLEALEGLAAQEGPGGKERLFEELFSPHTRPSRPLRFSELGRAPEPFALEVFHWVNSQAAPGGVYRTAIEEATSTLAKGGWNDLAAKALAILKPSDLATHLEIADNIKRYTDHARLGNEEFIRRLPPLHSSHECMRSFLELSGLRRR